MENKLPKRKSTRLSGYDYHSIGSYFITICSHNHENIFCEIVPQGLLDEPSTVLSPCGEIVFNCFTTFFAKYPTINIDMFAIMPNHIHFILSINERDKTLTEYVGGFKSYVTKICRENLGMFNIFQRSFTDHIIRDQEDYNIRANYILENPLRWANKNE